MAYRSMIAAQPLSVARCLDAARPEVERSDLAPFTGGTIAVTGIGASFAASIVVAAELARRGRRAIEDGGRLTVVRVPATDDRISRGILDILAAQLFAAELSDAAGLTDAKFRCPQADTKVP